MSDWRAWFEQCGYMSLQTAVIETSVTIEDLYQIFKARMREEDCKHEYRVLGGACAICGHILGARND